MLVGAWYATASVPAQVWWAALAAAALAAFANADNDVHDAAIDRVAHPARPIPAGRLSARTADRVASAAALAGVAFAAAARPALGLLSLVVVLAMRLYNRGGSARPALKNATVAVLASLPFAYGAWAAGRPRAGFLLAAVAAPLHFAREVAKDLDDAAADAGRRRTLPIVLGRRVALAAIALAVVAFAAAVWRLGAWQAHGAVLLPGVALAVAAALRAGRRRGAAPALFKLAMLASMLAAITLRAP